MIDEDAEATQPPWDLEGKTLVCCWELGGGLGHLTKALLLTEQLLDRGCRVAFLLRDLASVDDLLPREAYQVLQAPAAWGGLADWPSPADHSELLLHAGFGDGPGLRGRVRAWCDSFALLQADAVLADHAPTAVLAARCAGLPVALFGHGFFAPPAPWPVFRHWESVPAERLARSRQLALAEVNRCLQSHGRAGLTQLHGLLEVERNYLLSVPELDHYPRAPAARHWGVLANLQVGESPRWPQQPGPKVFAYLRPNLEGLAAVLEALAATQAHVLLRVAGVDPQLRARYPQFSWRDQLQRMDEVAAQADLVLCSGTDTAQSMVLSGVPVLMLPMQAEQRLAAERLAQAGAGDWALPGTAAAALQAKLTALLAPNASAKQAARQLSARHGPFDVMNSARRIADDCADWLLAR